MAKSLGKIHTVNHRCTVFDGGLGLPLVLDSPVVDASADLTRQLQRMVRQGQYYKLVGIDMSINASEFDNTGDGGILTGKLYYFSPTRGRCMAYRNAYKATTAVMRDQGINYRADDLYDFRVAFSEAAPLVTPPFPNVATLNGTDELVLVGGSNPQMNIFTVHNSNVAPANPLQTSPIPFGTYGNTSDFRLNEEQPFSGNEDAAHITPEFIPWSAAYDNDSEEFVVTLDWRPDPALYLAIMCGLFRIGIDSGELNNDNSLTMEWAFHISGWTSIMGNPDKKKKTSKRSSRGKKRSKK